ANPVQLLARLVAKLGDGRVVEAVGYAPVLQALEALHFCRLPVDVTAVLRLQYHLLHHVGPRVPFPECGVSRAHLIPLHLCSPPPRRQAIAVALVLLQLVLKFRDPPLLTLEARPVLVRHGTDTAAEWGESAVRVVVAK